MTAIDYFTRWVEAFPIRNQEAETVAKVLVEQVFCRYGVPMQILSDQGANFESRLFQEMCRLLRIDKLRTTAYKPRTNGLIERWHRVLNTMLAKVVADNHRDWHVQLPYVLAAYRATEHDVTGYTPNKIFLGREAIMPIDLTMGVVEMTPSSPEDFVEQQAELFREAYELVRSNTKAYVTLQKRRYDLKVKPKQFHEGDWVYYLYPRKRVGRSPKWTRMYTGPYLVVGVLNTLLFRIQKSARAKPIIAHVDKLKRVEGSVPRSWLCDKDDSIGEENGPLDIFDNPDETGIEERPRPVRKRRPPERLNDYVCRSREMPVDTGPPNDDLTATTGETDSQEVTAGRGSDLSEEDLTYDRCGGSGVNPAAEQLNWPEQEQRLLNILVLLTWQICLYNILDNCSF